MKLLTTTAAVLACVLGASSAFSFCGFYVAKADVSLFNTTSQVILARDGKRTVVTMASDFQGDVEDFAMVVPVPEVLARKNIRIAKHSIFDKLDTYTAPRVVEYHDPEPCVCPNIRTMYDSAIPLGSVMLESVAIANYSDKKYKVTIEAQYKVEEYDILILSAKESNGLKLWLDDNGY